LIAINLTFCSIPEKHTTGQIKLEGLWFCVYPDSTYAEVYFTDSVYCYYNEDLFFRIFGYNIEGDSLEVLDSSFEHKFKFEFLDSLNLTITSVNQAISYKKINDTVFSAHDWTEYLKGNSDLRWRYRQYFYARKQDEMEIRLKGN
jgi:hypothetical protein